jgi:hypothetical protein
MSSTTYALPAPSLSNRFSRVLETVRWAPAPRWGSTAAEHGMYVVYLVGSMLAWIVVGLGVSAALGAVL